MSKRPTLLDKAIKAIDDKIAALELARAELLEQRHADDLVRRPSTLKTVAK
jgi:hypothetical protein